MLNINMIWYGLILNEIYLFEQKFILQLKCLGKKLRSFENTRGQNPISGHMETLAYLVECF